MGHIPVSWWLVDPVRSILNWPVELETEPHSTQQPKWLLVQLLASNPLMSTLLKVRLRLSKWTDSKVKKMIIPDLSV